MASFKYIPLFSVIIVAIVSDVNGEEKRSRLDQEQIELAAKYIKSLGDKRNNLWVDPYDMFADQNIDISGEITPEKKLNHKIEGVTKKLESVLKDEKVKSTETPDEVFHVKSANHQNVCNKYDNIFLMRLIKRFTTKINEKVNAEWPKTISFELSKQQFADLNDIVKHVPPDLEDVDRLFSDVLSRAIIISSEPFSMSGTLKKYGFPIFMTILMIFLLVFVVLSYMVRPILTIIMFVVTVSISFQWLQLYQVALATKAAKLAINYDSVCRKSEFGILQSVGYYIRSTFVVQDTCQEFYEGVLVDSIYSASILKAISNTMSEFVLAPLVVLAKTGNTFIKILLADLPWLYMVFLGFFMFILLTMFCKYRIKLPLFSAFEPAFAPTSSNQQNINGLVLKEFKQLLSSEFASPVRSINNSNDSKQISEERLCQLFRESLLISENSGNKCMLPGVNVTRNLEGVFLESASTIVNESPEYSSASSSSMISLVPSDLSENVDKLHLITSKVGQTVDSRSRQSTTPNIHRDSKKPPMPSDSVESIDKPQSSPTIVNKVTDDKGTPSNQPASTVCCDDILSASNGLGKDNDKLLSVLDNAEKTADDKNTCSGHPTSTICCDDKAASNIDAAASESLTNTCENILDKSN